MNFELPWMGNRISFATIKAYIATSLVTFQQSPSSGEENESPTIKLL